MKNEIKAFDKKTIKEIQTNYKGKIKKEEKQNAMQILREETKRYQKLMFYKKELDSGKIKEEDIPEEYVDELRNIYEEKIVELKRILKKSN